MTGRLFPVCVAALLLGGSVSSRIAPGAPTPGSQLLPHTEVVRPVSPLDRPFAEIDRLLDEHNPSLARPRLQMLSARAGLTELDRLGIERRQLRLIGELGRLADAGPRLDAIERAAAASGDVRDLAWVRLTRGQINFVKGDRTAALAAWEEARTLFQRVGDTRGEFEVLDAITIAQSTLDARGEFERAFSIARSLGDPILEGRARLRWAMALAGSGHFASALAESQSAAAGLRPLGARAEWYLSSTLGVVAWALRGHGALDEAIAADRESLAISLRRGDHEEAAWHYQGLGFAYLELRRYEAASLAMRRGLAEARRIEEPTLVGSLSVATARVALERKRWAEAAALLEPFPGKPLGQDPVYPMIWLATARRELHQVAEAREMIDRALELAREEKLPDAEIHARVERARVLDASGRTTEATDEARAALDTLESLRSQLAPVDFLKQGFGDSHHLAYGVAVDLLVRSGRAADALSAAERARGRALADLLVSRQDRSRRLADDTVERWRLGAGELRRTTAPAPSGVEAESAPTSAIVESAVGAAALDASGMQDLAARLTSTLIVYWIDEAGSYVWAVSPGGAIHAAPLDIGLDRLATLITGASAMLPSVRVRGGSAADAHTDASRADLGKLYHTLVAPIEAWLPTVPGARLTIVPHGPLFRLSFATLRDGRGRYLIERYAIHYAPSGAVLAYALDERPPATAQPTSLLVADPQPPAEAEGGAPLPPLEGARREVAQIRALLPGVKPRVLLGEAATETAVRRYGRDARVLHFASHALVPNDDPLSPYLVLARGPAGAESGADGRLTALEVYGLRFTADLVVLSACHSAKGVISSDGIAGLMRAFLASGAPSVVASLWEAADEPTARLMTGFYGAYARSQPKDQALRAAQLAVLRALRAGRIQTHVGASLVTLPEDPFFWGGFILTGAP
jgi:CHAT domain-containing protein/tetratricopeptide (TPR) repeat protein